jgi:hypothetical protein
MIKGIYSIFDQVAKVHFPPFLQTSEAEAVRFFGHIRTDPAYVLHKSPADYELVRIGVFDDLEGTIVPEYTHINC